MILLLITAFIFQAFVNIESYRILGLFPHHGKSHFDVFGPIMKSLAEKGHEVTVISHYPLLSHQPRYKDISLKGSLDLLFELKPVDSYVSKIEGWLISPIVLRDFANMTCEKTLNVKGVQELMKSKEKFDIIIAEVFNSDCLLGFVHKFGAPFIGISSSSLMPWAADRFGQPDNPSYIPDNLLRFTDKMSFIERVENTIVLLVHKLIYRFYYEPNDQRIAVNHFGRRVPQLRKVAYNASLVLVNTHYSLNLPRPNVPGVIEIGGVHIRKMRKLNTNYSFFDAYSVDTLTVI